MAHSVTRPVTPALLQTRLPGATASLLALLLVWECLPPRPAAPGWAPADHPIRAAPDNTAGLAVSWTTAILARPLFRPGRRPPAALAVANEDTPPPRLSAIIITATGRSAIFIGADGSASVLGIGGHSGAYQVETINPDSARLSGPDGSLTLHPQFAGGDSTAPPDPTPEAAPAPPLAPPPASAPHAPLRPAPHPQRNRFDESDQ